MNRNQICSISGSDLVDSRLEDEDQTGGAKLCPGCGHILDRRDDWVGLPAGVKFDPTDQELMEHLEAKVRCEELRSHPLIDEFIPTIEGEDGICYTHPEKLPGVSKDGLSKHFFHRPSKAYTTGTRKRRKIQTEPDSRLQGSGSSGGGETRWHKTGKTRPVMVNGRQKGCKKILVLYTNFGKHRKPEKTNWVMHQYHLGVLEEERDGELVVSKVFYQTQPRQCGGSGGGAGWPIDNRKEAPAVTTTGMGSAEDLACVAAGISGYGGGGGDTFSFAPFRKSFDEVGTEQAIQACGDHLDVHVTAASAFHVSRRTVPVSGMVAAASHHQSSVVLVEPYQRLIIQNHGLEISINRGNRSIVIERLQKPQQNLLHTLMQQRIYLLNLSCSHMGNIKFLQHHEEEQGHQKLIRRPSSSGLEDVIMGCTADGLGGPEASVPSRQQQGWLGYSYWPDTDNQNQPR